MWARVFHSSAQAADIENMSPHTATAVTQLHTGPSQGWRLLLIIRKRKEMRKRKIGPGLGCFLPPLCLPNSSSPSILPRARCQPEKRTCSDGSGAGWPIYWLQQRAGPGFGPDHLTWYPASPCSAPWSQPRWRVCLHTD